MSNRESLKTLSAPNSVEGPDVGNSEQLLTSCKQKLEHQEPVQHSQEPQISQAQKFFPDQPSGSVFSSSPNGHQNIKKGSAVIDSADSLIAKPRNVPLRYPNKQSLIRYENGSLTKAVKIVYTVDPSTFYCQLAENLDYFQGFMERLNAAYADESKKSILKTNGGMACVAKYSCDNRWYRGRIVCVVSKEYEILFVDYGYRRMVPISFVKEIEKEFIDLPFQAYKCCLKDGTNSNDWSTQDKVCFAEATLGKQFEATFKQCGSAKALRYSVVLSENLADGSCRFINDIFKPSRGVLPVSNLFAYHGFQQEADNAESLKPRSKVKESKDGQNSKAKTTSNASDSAKTDGGNLQATNFSQQQQDSLMNAVLSQNTEEKIQERNSAEPLPENPVDSVPECENSNLKETQSTMSSTDTSLELAKSLVQNNVPMKTTVDDDNRLPLPIHEVQETVSSEFNFVNCPGSRGGVVRFETSERHFYRHLQNYCSDHQFFVSFDPAVSKTKFPNCKAKPGEFHNHELLSQEMLELAVIRWACTLRVIDYHTRETNLESIDAVVSLWPHKLSIPVSSIEVKFSTILNRYRKGAENGEEFVSDFLDQYGEKELELFTRLILGFRDDPIDPQGPTKSVTVKSPIPQKKRRRTERVDMEQEDVDDEANGRSLRKLRNLGRVTSSDVETVSDRACSSDTDNLKAISDKETRLVDELVRRSKKVGTKNGIRLYALPLTKSNVSSSENFPDIFHHFVMENVAGSTDVKVERKTILLMGATDSGKSSLINAMINFILVVDWKDPFRFQIIDDFQEEKECIKAYEIRHSEGFRIPFSLTIVDVCGYGLHNEPNIAEMILKVFKLDNALQLVDMIGLVAHERSPMSIPTMESLLSLFGNDLDGNISYLLTYPIHDKASSSSSSTTVESSLPGLINATTTMPVFHLTSSYSWTRKSDPSGSLWQAEIKNFESFFSSLTTKETKPMLITKWVLGMRNSLENTLDALQLLQTTGLVKMKQMNQIIKQIIPVLEARIESYKNKSQVRKVKLQPGLYAANCLKCGVTCGDTYSSVHTTTPACPNCPAKCKWNLHSFDDYRLEHPSAVDVSSHKQNVAELPKMKEQLEQLKKDIGEIEREVFERSNIVGRCILRLNEIAIYPIWVKPASFDQVMKAEKQMKISSFGKRIEMLAKRRQNAIIFGKVANKEALLKLVDQHEDETNK